MLPAEDRDRLGELSATTLHRLLGWRPEARTRFRHDRGNRLPYEVVVVDESSMVSLTMMARLLEALRPTTRLVLVGDPDQLASVEAGAVLGDVVQSVEPGARTPGRAAALAALGSPPLRRWTTATAPGCATASRRCWSTGASRRRAASPGCPGRCRRVTVPRPWRSCRTRT
jgi:exodeoxyribonuclease V alpha subunit